MQDGGVRCWVVDVISVPNPDPIFRFSLLLYSYVHLSQRHKINLVIDAIDDDRLDWEGVTNQVFAGFRSRPPASVFLLYLYARPHCPSMFLLALS